MAAYITLHYFITTYLVRVLNPIPNVVKRSLTRDVVYQNYTLKQHLNISGGKQQQQQQITPVNWQYFTTHYCQHYIHYSCLDKQ